MKIDWTISLGELLMVLSVILGWVAFIFKLDKRLSIIEAQLQPIIEWWNNGQERRHIISKSVGIGT